MHTYRILTDQSELDKHLVPIFQDNGSEIPPSGHYVAAVEFDENGVVVAYQLMQNAIFLEGLWARDTSAHLLAVYHAAEKYITETLKVDRWLTMTRNDEQGNRIGKLARKLGFKQMDWLIFRRQK